MRGGQERHYTKAVHLPYTRIRTVVETRSGDVRRFLVQLEYNVARQTAFAEQWEGVARFDHNPSAHDGHDIRTEGLHMDICEPNDDDKRATGFPPVAVNDAPKWCENYLERDHLRLTKRFCYKYGIENWRRPTRR